MPDPAIRDRFLAVGTSNVGDALDDMERPDQGVAPHILPMSGTKLAGWAYTIAGQMTPYEGKGDPAKMQACNGLSEGEIAVWAGDGQGICYFGELIALGMQERGCVGAIVDGGVRDVAWLAHHGFPVFAAFRTPIQSIGRWQVTTWQEPVDLPGATCALVKVHPGDFIVADEDGIVVVPAELIDPVLSAAERLTATEVQIRAALAQGSTLAECLERFGHV